MASSQPLRDEDHDEDPHESIELLSSTLTLGKGDNGGIHQRTTATTTAHDGNPLQPMESSHPLNSQESSSQLVSESQHDTYTTTTIWEPSTVKHAPWLALLALGIAVLCTVACIVILEEADGRPTSAWKFAPTVYLSILTTVVNVCLGVAFAKGAVISWWLNALRGCTVNGLSEVWSYGEDLMSSVLAVGRLRPLRTHRLALAKILLTIVLIDGPLLQRAVTVVPHTKSQTVPMTASIAPEIPGDYTATRNARTSLLSPSTDYVSVMQSYSSREPIKTPFNATCEGSCRATILAAGLSAVNCTDFNTTVDFGNSMPDPWSGDTVKYYPIFQVSVDEVSTIWGGDGSDTESSYGNVLILTVARPVIEEGSCKGQYVTRWCPIKSAVAQYPIKIDNDVVSFAEQIHHPKIVALSNASTASTQKTTVAGTPTTIGGGQRTTIGGLQSTADELFTANATWFRDAIYGWQPQGANIFTMQYLWPNASAACLGTVRDPTNDILSAFNEILFRTSIHAASPGTKVNLTNNPIDPGLTLYQQVDVQQLSTHNVYQVVDWALWTAVALMGLGVIVVIPTLWGWWSIGANVSLNPIETARAFGAPLLWRIRDETDELQPRGESARGLHGKRSFLGKWAFWRNIGRKTRSHTTAILRYGESLSGEKVHSDVRPQAPEGSIFANGPKRLQFGEAKDTLKPRKNERYAR